MGSGIAANLFGTDNPIGKDVKIGSSQFTVIGVMAPQGTVGGTDADGRIYIPVTVVFGAVLRASALAAAEELDATVASMRFVKPLDTELVLRLARDHDALVTVEENVVMGGAGSAVGEALAAAGHRLPAAARACPTPFLDHGDPAQLSPTAGSTPRASAAVPANFGAPAAGGGLQSPPRNLAAHVVYNPRHESPEFPQAMFPIPDLSRADERNLAIDRVGVRGLRYPLAFVDADGVAQPTIAVSNVYVSLPRTARARTCRGWSRCSSRSAHPVRRRSPCTALRDLLDALVVLLEAPGGRIELAFPYFIGSRPRCPEWRAARYEVRIDGELDGGAYRQPQVVAVPVTSLCPCSKEISEYGAHNQRSTVTITVCPARRSFSTDMIRVAEEEARCELYGLLKRADEKYVTSMRITIRSSSRTWCAESPRGSPPIRGSTVSRSKPRTSSRSTTTRRTRGSCAGCSPRNARTAAIRQTKGCYIAGAGRLASVRSAWQHDCSPRSGRG